MRKKITMKTDSCISFPHELSPGLQEVSWPFQFKSMKNHSASLRSIKQIQHSIRYLFSIVSNKNARITSLQLRQSFHNRRSTSFGLQRRGSSGRPPHVRVHPPRMHRYPSNVRHAPLLQSLCSSYSLQPWSHLLGLLPGSPCRTSCSRRSEGESGAEPGYKQNEERPRSFLVLSDRSRGLAAADSACSCALPPLAGAIISMANDNISVQNESYCESF